jgi:hypothetical protein
MPTISAEAISLRIDLNSAPGAIAASLQALFSAAGAISLVDLRLTKSPQTPAQDLLVCYRTPGPVEYQADVFVGGASSATDQANAFLAASPTRRGAAILDLGGVLRSQVDTDILLLVTFDHYQSGCGAKDARARIVSPTAQILAGATGAADLVTRDGVLVGADYQIDVVNSSDFTWPAGSVGWAVLDRRTLTWYGYPSCCFAPP